MVSTTANSHSILIYGSLNSAIIGNPLESIGNGSGLKTDERIDIARTDLPHDIVGSIAFGSDCPSGTTLIKLTCEELSSTSSSSINSLSSHSSESTSTSSVYGVSESSISSHSMVDLSHSSLSSSFSTSSTSIDSSSSSSLLDNGICLSGRDSITIDFEETYFIIKDAPGAALYWDYGKIGQHLFTFVGESITRIVNQNTYSIVYYDNTDKCVFIIKTDDASTSSVSTSSSLSSQSSQSDTSMSSLLISSSTISSWSSFSQIQQSISQSSFSESSTSSWEKRLQAIRYRFSGMQMPKVTLEDGFEYDYIPVNTNFTHQPEYYAKPFYYGTVTDRTPQPEILKAEANQAMTNSKESKSKKETKVKKLFNLLPVFKPKWYKK